MEKLARIKQGRGRDMDEEEEEKYSEAEETGQENKTIAVEDEKEKHSKAEETSTVKDEQPNPGADQGKQPEQRMKKPLLVGASPTAMMALEWLTWEGKRKRQKRRQQENSWNTRKGI